MGEEVDRTSGLTGNEGTGTDAWGEIRAVDSAGRSHRGSSMRSSSNQLMTTEMSMGGRALAEAGLPMRKRPSTREMSYGLAVMTLAGLV